MERSKFADAESKFLFGFEIIWGLFSLSLTVILLYLTFRWATTLIWANDETRERLMGPVFYPAFGRNDDWIYFFSAFYLGYKLLHALVSLVRWQRFIDFEHKRLIAKHEGAQLIYYEKEANDLARKRVMTQTLLL